MTIMEPRAPKWAFRGILSFLLALETFADRALSQNPAPVAPNPRAPVINMPLPNGAQRGQSLELTLMGSNLANPTGLWTSFPATISFPPDKNNGKDNSKLRVELQISRDAPIGFQAIRLATTEGMSNVRLFCIDDLPQITEADTNHSRATAQSVSLPCVVVGRADAETADYFKFTAKAGERVSFEVLGRRLGSALDPQITLLDGRTGRELTGGYNNDAPGLQTDPRLSYTFKTAGEYLIEVRDTLYRGGPDFWYHLRMGDFPCATTPLPMAARRGSQLAVSFAGSQVENISPVEITVPQDPTLQTIWVAPKGANGLYGWPVALAVSDHEELLEHEPNNDPAHANRVNVPGGITGRFLTSGDIDYYVFSAKKGSTYAIEAQTLELYSPSEVYLALKDSKGNQLAATNPQTAPRLVFKPPADGDYFVTVEHLLYWSGPAESYRLTITPDEPGFELSAGLDRFDVHPGASAVVPIWAVRKGYTGPIEVQVIGHPDISGHITIPPGQPAAANQPAGTLFLTASSAIPPGPYELAIQGSATINNRTVLQLANLRSVVSRELGGLPFPPRNLLTQIGLAVTQRAPFTLSAHVDHPVAARGLPLAITLRATRIAGFSDEIAISPVAMPQNVTAAVKSIPKGQDETQIRLTPAANAPLGQFAIGFAGKAKFQNKEFNVISHPIYLELALPFELAVEPQLVQVIQGGKAQISARATRKAYQGPIVVELRGLPANVTAAKATIAMGQTTADIEVKAGQNAALGDKNDLAAFGIIADAPGFQQPSPNFKISIMKKK